MTISPWLIYFADKADAVVFTFVTIALIFMVIQIILISNVKKEDLDEAKKNNQRVKVSLKPFYIFIGFLILAALMPSTSTCYKMFIIPKIVNSKLVQKLPDYLTAYIEKELKGATDEQ